MAHEQLPALAARGPLAGHGGGGQSARRGDAVGAVATAAARRATHAASPAASHPAWLSGERDMACARTDDAVWVVNAAIAFVALNQIESGKTPDPGVSRIIGIARVLGVSTDALLLGGKDEDATLPAPPPAKRRRPRKAAPLA
jgi:hypothetical protein